MCLLKKQCKVRLQKLNRYEEDSLISGLSFFLSHKRKNGPLSRISIHIPEEKGGFIWLFSTMVY